MVEELGGGGSVSGIKNLSPSGATLATTTATARTTSLKKINSPSLNYFAIISSSSICIIGPNYPGN